MRRCLALVGGASLVTRYDLPRFLDRTCGLALGGLLSLLTLRG